MEEMSPSLALPFSVSPIKLASDPDPMNEDCNSPPSSAPMEEVRSDPQSDDDSLSVGPSVGSPCSVNSDCSSIASSLEDFSVSSSSFPDSFEPTPLITGQDLILPEAPLNMNTNPVRARSVFLLEYVPLWGFTSIIGRRPEMEDAVSVVPNAFEVPLRMLTGETGVDGLDLDSFKLPAHFFGVYDGHGGAQVADYCRERIHTALIEELNKQQQEASTSTSTTDTGTRTSSTGANANTVPEFKKKWEKAFIDCFTKVDDEIGGKRPRPLISISATQSEEATQMATQEGDQEATRKAAGDAVAPETVGTTAVVAVVCNSHVIVANCGDSRAVLCRGKQAVPLSVDHKPNREDEYARIEAAGGKVIQWNGYRVFGVLAMSRSIGDRYLKPWIIPVPEVSILPRAKDDECLILASDGLWDVMSNEEACDMARKRILLWHKKNGASNNSNNLNGLNNNGSGSDRGGEYSDPAAQAAAECLAKLALQKGSKDNITVVVVDLKAQRKFKVKS